MRTRQHNHILRELKGLLKDRSTVDELSGRLGVSKRSVYRYLAEVEELGLPIEQDFENKYFIIEE